MLHYALIMLLAGIGIPILAALNAGLGVRLGSPVAASMFLFALAFALAAIVLLLTGQAPALKRTAGVPWHFFLGGLFVAFYVLSVTFIAPKFGVGNAVFFVLIGQLISAAAIDQFGLFSANVTPLTATRALGIGVMALGVWITQRV
ncbi:DMT family transporter [Mesobacterium pallidum]|uniref:DMT family transporter n=1 Tax=Mesobacterium pallidum TaxID=2872037 RepID=UPI001EE28070|nr:DMT family transporter [Mesobacterium pallidum]